MPRPRLRTVAIAAAVLLVVVVTALLVALPEIVRRVAVTQLTRLTGRAVALERVELNLFTGRVALSRFRLAQRNSSEPAFDLEGAEVRVSVASLVTSHARVASVTLTRPRLRVARLTPTEFDFSDLLALIPPADPKAKPSNRTVTIERVALSGGELTARDDVTATAWKVEGLTIDGNGLSTRGGPPGRITVRAKLNGTPLALEVGAIDLAKGAALARATVDGFEVVQVSPFVPPMLGVTPAAGRLSAALDLQAETGTPSPSVVVAGTARLEGLAVHRAVAGTPGPAGATADDGRIVSVGTVAVAIKDAQPLARVITLDSIAIDGVDLRVTRLADGRIDLLELAARPGPSDAAAAPAKPETSATPPATTGTDAARDVLRVALRELTLRNSKVTMRDETVGATLGLSDLGATVRDLTWPATGPLTFEVATGLPSAGRLQVKGGATLAPITADFTMSMRGAPIAPYQPYLPIPGRIVGVFNGESRSRVAIADGKLTMAVSQGRSWIENLELRPPDATTGPAKIARVAIEGIDFTHPGRAKARSITITKPELRVERDAAGEINLRQLFAKDTPPISTTRTPGPSDAKPTPAPAPVPAGPKPSAGRAQTTSATAGASTPIPLEIGTFAIEDGYARFLDRTTKPAFSEEISKLAVKIEGLSSEPGRRAKLAVQAVVGGDSALDLKGEVAPFGELYADVAGELRNFVLPSVNPYADTAIAWIIERGTLAVRLHYTVEKNQLTAQNEIIVDNLHVARSKSEDEVQKRIGLPLGLIVALVTDSNNGIRVNLPLKGSLDSWSADLSDAIWTAVKNVVVNIVAAPFRAIGRAFTGGGDKIESLAIDPAKFTAGNATLAADAESHLTKVADFLRRSPAIRLTLAPFTTAADGESLRGQELTARLQRVQREAKLDDLAAAVAAEFKRVFPEEPLPKSTEEQLARLREKEPVPAEAVGQLATRRLEAVRTALIEREGIPAGRLAAGEAATAPAGDGRVEFKITQ